MNEYIKPVEAFKKLEAAKLLKQNEVRFCETDFCSCGLFHLAIYLPLLFYMLFDQVSMKDQTVGSYQAAKKKYVILGIDDKEASE